MHGEQLLVLVHRVQLRLCVFCPSKYKLIFIHSGLPLIKMAKTFVLIREVSSGEGKLHVPIHST